MITRHGKDSVYRLASQFPVVGIVGPRQSGKTTISKELFPQKQYITFDDINMRRLPLSLGELSEGGLIGDSVHDLILKGLHPPLYDSKKTYITEDWFESYTDTCLVLDIKDEINPSSVTFQSFFNLKFSDCRQMQGTRKRRWGSIVD